MRTLQILSISLVLVGAGFMFFSVLFSARLLKRVPAVFLGRWKVLTGLTVFFLAGYLTFMVGQAIDSDLPLEPIAGMVFLGGAIFVFLIINLTNKTIITIREGEQQLRQARNELEVRVAQRTEQLQQTLVDLEREIHGHQEASTALEKVNTELLQILNSSADGIRVIDDQFIIRRVNRTFAQLAGIPADRLIGMPCHEVFKHSSCHSEDCSLTKIFEGAPMVENEKVLETRDGKIIPCLITAFPYRAPDGTLIGIVEGFRDITQRKVMENRLQMMSITDELTGLLNRRGFIAIAEKQIRFAERLDTFLYLLYLDLDNMKEINDKLGHETGDQALKETAEVLKSTLRKSDVVGIGRLGGDEFTALMFSSQPPGARHPVIERLEEQIAERNRGSGRSYQLSFSVGLVRYNPQEPCSLEQFLARGDAAMYDCKKAKKERTARLTPPVENEKVSSPSEPPR